MVRDVCDKIPDGKFSSAQISKYKQLQCEHERSRGKRVLHLWCDDMDILSDKIEQGETVRLSLLAFRSPKAKKIPSLNDLSNAKEQGINSLYKSKVFLKIHSKKGELAIFESETEIAGKSEYTTDIQGYILRVDGSPS